MKLDSTEISELESDIGIYYHEDDYASFSRRIIAAIIDISVIILFSSMILLFTRVLNDQINIKSSYLFLISLTLVYFTFFKRSKLRTIGYILTRIKIVDLSGSKPSLYNMFMRVILLIAGPDDYSKSIELVKIEKTKQSLRDKYLGNYVVNVNAKPIGSGPIITVANRYGSRHIFRYKKVENGKENVVGEKKTRDYKAKRKPGS